jgi:peptide subunit release factor 1 (eRF1)
MQISQLDRDKLRQLAGLDAGGAKVLSLYLNLDPSEFATPQARSTEIRSLLDEADRRLREFQNSHDDKAALRGDLQRVQAFLKDGDFKGAHGLALFCSGPAGLFEVIKLPRPVDSGVSIGDEPFVEPLTEIASDGNWCVVLVSRRMGRILRGSREGLREVARVTDDVHGWHDQGGWSQARYQRSIEKETHDHVKNTADELFRRFRRNPFDRLLLGAPEELVGSVEERLHPYVRERLAGRIDVDVENSSPDDISLAAAPVIEEEDRRSERDALDRLAEGLGTGSRAAAGLDDVLAALNERRVETLLIEESFAGPGVICPQCGWLGVTGSACPADGAELEEREDVVDSAVHLAINQSAEVIVVRRHDDLEQKGSIAAVLRF